MAETTELQRNRREGRIAGVCAAYADQWGVDPFLVRVAWVLLGLSGGIGLVLYAVAWAALPAEGKPAPIDEYWPAARRLPKPAQVAGIVVACLIVASVLYPVMPFGVGPALVMAAVWWFGYWRPKQQRVKATGRPAQPVPGERVPHAPFAEQTAFTAAAAAWQQRVQEHLASASAPVQGPRAPMQGPMPQDAAQPTRPSYVADPGYSMSAFLAHPDPVGLYTATATAPTDADLVERERRAKSRARRVRWATVIAVGIALTAVGILSGRFELPRYVYPAAALLPVGLALMISARRGRVKGLATVGVLLALLTAFAAGPNTSAIEQAPTRIAYSSVHDLPARPVNKDAGALELDLSQVSLTEDRQLSSHVDFGTLTVYVPRGTNVVVDWQVDMGEAVILDREYAGGADLRNVTRRTDSPDAPTLTLKLSTNMGALKVVEK